MKSKIEAENRIVAFIDILGFKNIINEAEKQNSYKSIYKIISSASLIFKPLNKNSDFQFTHFSDSFVLSLKNFSPNESMLFLVLLQDLVSSFLNESILLRGGITIGKVIHTSKVLLGPGIVRAYELESKFAGFPRIIIDEELIDLWEYQLGREGYNFENVFELSKDKDGFYFMDYISKSPLVSNRYLSKIDTIIETLLNSNNKSLKRKGRWLKFHIKRGYTSLKVKNKNEAV
jgi:hypothetical protein